MKDVQGSQKRGRWKLIDHFSILFCYRAVKELLGELFGAYSTCIYQKQFVSCVKCCFSI
jgi:hypothetical protein